MATDQEHELDKDNFPDHAGVAFHPPLLLGVLLAVGFGLRAFVPMRFLPEGLASIGGPIIVVASLALFVWAVRTMRGSGASIPTSEPTDVIVQAGPYRISRNPIYLDMVLLLTGVGVWANSLWLIGMAVVDAILLSWGVISREEAYLQRKFGEKYPAYAATVRRWL